MNVLKALTFALLSIIDTAPSDQANETRSNNMERARRNTLKMTISIVATFVLCWTPYAVMVFWFQLDQISAEKVPHWLMSTFFIFAFSSSCVDPFLHSRHLVRCSKNLRPRHANPSPSSLRDGTMATQV